MASNERGKAIDRQRDDKNRVIVDIVRPHIIEDPDYFRGPAIHFQKYGRYTDIMPNRNKKF